MSQYFSLRPWIAASVSCLMLYGCGGGNTPAGPAPNVGNIPNLSKQPTADSTAPKKLKMSGRVFNALTHEPVERATIWIHLLEPAAVPTPTAVPTAVTPQPATTPTQLHTPPAPTSPTSGPSPLPTPGTGDIPNSPLPTFQPSLQRELPAAQPLMAGLLFLAGPLGAGPALAEPFQLAQQPTPSPKADSHKSYRTTTNNQGKFWLDNIPDGTHAMTIQAPQFRTLTVIKINPARLDIPLAPMNGDEETTEVAGMVLSPSEKPVANAQVSPSFIVGDSVGIPGVSNGMGEFSIPAVSYGTHTFAALVLDDENVIRQMGLEKGLKLTRRNVKAKSTVLNGRDKDQPTPPPGDATQGKPDKASPKPGDNKRLNELTDEVENILKATPEPDVSPETAATASPSPGDTEASPQPSPADSPAAPASPLPKIEEEEEKETDKEEKPGFNLFKQLGGLLTGKEADDADALPVYPVITVRSVLSELALEGTVTAPEGYKVKNVDVYLTLNPERPYHTEEVYLFSQPLTPKAAAAAAPKEGKDKDAKAGPTQYTFELKLPNLEKGQSYHLQLTATHTGTGDKKTNAILYRHLYGLEESKPDIDVQFMPPTAEISIAGEKDNAIPLTPHISWPAVPGADIYRVLLEAGKEDNSRTVWEAWTPDTEITYPLTAIPGRLQQGEIYRVSVSALKGIAPPKKPKSDEAYIHPAYHATWTDLSQHFYQKFEVVKTN